MTEASDREVAATSAFDYSVATSRNIGWVTESEQGRLQSAKVAIAGLGGVGGAHLITLTRLGIGNFHIADFDHFELQNFNRQAGASIPHIGQSKVEVMAKLAREVNPEASIQEFAAGVTPSNVGSFLDGVDLYVDGIDFFAVPARRLLFAACRERGIPALTAAPLGMGVSLLYFDPRRMSFEDYFKLEGHDEQEQYARFIAGLSPSMLQRKYLVVPDAVDFAEQRGPSTVMACDLCAGVIGCEALKIILQRGRLRPAPWAMQFDAYRHKLKFTWRPSGNDHPLQKVLLRMVRAKLGSSRRRALEGAQ